MFGFMKSPGNKITKQNSVDPPGASSTNPFDSDTELDKKQTLKPARRTSSEPALITPDFKKSNPFDDDDDDDGLRGYAPSKNKNKSSAYSSGDLDSMSTQELEGYAVDRAQETTKSVNNCLKIAEDIRQDASKTLDTLHQQGEQIHRTHLMATDMERDLSKGEKILGNLGGMFSMTWKPKKGKEIKGPMTFKDDNSGGKAASKEQREKLGLAPAPKGKSASRTPPPEPTNALQKVELEKEKQDDALGDLSNILGDLKGMAVDMGSELDRQNKALDLLEEDVDELSSRVKGANQRTRKLLGK